MKVFSRFAIGCTLVFALFANPLQAANYTKDYNGWAYSEIRGVSYAPVIVPLGLVATLITVGILFDSSGHHHHHHNHAH